MNSHSQQSKRRVRWSSRGQGMVEMAVALPVLVLLLLVATDFGRLYYTNIEVADAARAGAQYGSQSLISAANSAGMAAVAKIDASNLSNLTAVASQCTCMVSSTVPMCPADYCASNPGATFVEVDTSTTFSTIFSYPGIPSKITLAGKAIMMVQSQ